MRMTDFARARLDEMERYVKRYYGDNLELLGTSLVLIESQRMVLELHDSFPTMVQTEPRFEPSPTEDFDVSYINQVTFKVSQQMKFMENQAFYAEFGYEPPTTPFMKKFLDKYRNHPDFQQEWIS